MKNVKKSFFFVLSALSLMSCGGSEISMALGNGMVENDAVNVQFTLPDTIKEKDKISFKFTAEKEVSFASEYTFSIFNVNPLKSESYQETILLSFSGKELQSKKKDDGSYEDYVVEFTFADLTSLFKKTEGQGNGSFVFHRDDWSRGDITKYSTFDYKYSYSGDSVKISSIYD